MNKIFNSMKSAASPSPKPLDLGHLAKIEARLLLGEFSYEWVHQTAAFVVRNSTAPTYRGGPTRYANAEVSRNRMICHVPREEQWTRAESTATFLTMFGNLAPFMCASLQLGRYDGDLLEFYKMKWTLDAAMPGRWESRGIRDDETSEITSPARLDALTQKPVPFIRVEHANREHLDDTHRFVVNARADAEWLIEQMRPLVQTEFKVEGSAKRLIVDVNDAPDIEHLQPFKLNDGGEIVSVANERKFIADAIMPAGADERVIHINGDRYDCRRVNLRASGVTTPHALNLEPEVINRLHQQAQLRGMTPNGFLKAIL